jgi:hypothetical protein
MQLSSKHLLGIRDLLPGDIQLIFSCSNPVAKSGRVFYLSQVVNLLNIKLK